MTEKEGTINYLTRLRNENKIDEKTYQKQLEIINNVNLMDLYYKQRSNFNNGFRNGDFNYRGSMGNFQINNNNPYPNYEPNPNNYNQGEYDEYDAYGPMQ